MKITVFGSNGRVGREVVKYALGKGHEVTAYMRPNRYLDDEHPNLTCVRGELNDFEQMKSAVSDADAVIVTLGGFFQDSMPDVYRNVVKVTEEAGPKRFVCLMTPVIKADGDKFCWDIVFPRVATKFFFGKGRKHVRMCGEFVKNSKLDWTIVRHLEPVEGPYTGDVKVGFHVKQKITRANLAGFMVDQAGSKEYIRKMPIVGS